MEKPLRRANLNQAVRNYIKQYILDNGLTAGDPLPPEAHLAEDMGVGRSSVREAVRALQSLGIVETRQGDGLYVREYNFDPVLETIGYGMQFHATTLAELAQIRFLLESATIESAVRCVGTEELDRLEELMKSWEERVRSLESDTDLDKEFHRTLYSALGNQTLINLLEVFWVAFEPYDDPTIQEYQPMEESLESHREILEAVKAGDAALARQRLMQHYGDLKDRINRVAGITNEDWLLQD